MKKGIVNKQGKYWRINSPDLKNPLTVMGNFGLTDDMEGKEVEFDNSGGPVKLIRYEGKDYKKQQVEQQSRPPSSRSGRYEDRRGRNYDRPRHDERPARNSRGNWEPARAPYNFVPLNSIPVPGEKEVGHDRFWPQPERLSGYISLQIETKTPLFIRGNKENFLNPDGKIVLPGSSLRGLVRSLTEMVSHSKFKATEQYEDKKMYYRAMADMALDLRNQYKQEMQEDVEAGYLQFDKTEKTYTITPATGFDRVPVQGEFRYQQNRDGYEVHSGQIPRKKRNWLVFEPSAEKPLKVDDNLIEAYQNDYKRSTKDLDLLRIARQGKHKDVSFPSGVPVFFKRDGNIVTSFGHTRFYRLPYTRRISDHVPEGLETEAFLDLAESIFGTVKQSGKKTIKAGRVFFEDATPISPDATPTELVVLKILSTPNPTTFQHYLEQKPDGYQTESRDLKHWESEADIRGYKQYWHRDINGKENEGEWKEESFSVKKRDFEKYLTYTTGENSVNQLLSDLEIYNDVNRTQKIKITGDLNLLPEKLRVALTRFHNLDPQEEKKLGIDKPQNALVRVVKEDVTFRSRIRFENLTCKELGALLFALDLPEECAHKIGMGKPLGLGSIRITPTLTLIDRKTRYELLFEGQGNWETGESDKEDTTSFKDDFAKYIGEKTNQPQVNSAESYWSEDARMQELKTMLTLNHDMSDTPIDWNSRTRYMELPEFKKRPVLPKSLDVKKKGSKKDLYFLPPTNVIKQGDEAVRRLYIESTQKGQDFLFEAKMTLVGDGGAGKTTLLKRLQNDDTIPERTRGIDIVKHSFINRLNQVINLNIWDFGGQDIYYAIHNFFFSENSLYLLLTNTRSPEDNFDYWIPNIALFGGKSPIMVIKNKWEDFPRDISISRFLQIEDFKVLNDGGKPYETNLLDKTDFDKIKESIYHEIQQLPKIKQMIAKTWIEVRQQLKNIASTKPHISFEQFTKLCEEKGMSDLENIKILAQYLHDLGIVLWYRKIPQLKSKIILQPEWVTNAVYKIVDDTDIQQRKGRFNELDLKRLWHSKEYEDMHDELIELMQEFKICYKKKRENEYIVPVLLIQNEPKNQWDKNEWIDIRMQYKYLFMPKGIVNQLTAELHHKIKSDKSVWSRGVILADYLAEARVTEDWYWRTINIEVKGLNARGLLQVIIEKLEEINKTYPGINVIKEVPCICSKCRHSDKPEKFDFNKLIAKLERGGKIVTCNESDESVNIENLLWNVGADYGRERTTKRGYTQKKVQPPIQQNQPFNIFFSYSKKDLVYRNELDEHLSPLKRRKDIDTWYDQDISPGEEWDSKIKDQLATADIILLLVSSSFLATKYIMETEVPKAMERHEKREARIIPIILRHCDWEETDLASLLALPDKGDPITSYDDKDEAYLEVANGIKTVIEELKKYPLKK